MTVEVLVRAEKYSGDAQIKVYASRSLAIQEMLREFDAGMTWASSDEETTREAVLRGEISFLADSPNCEWRVYWETREVLTELTPESEGF